MQVLVTKNFTILISQVKATASIRIIFAMQLIDIKNF